MVDSLNPSAAPSTVSAAPAPLPVRPIRAAQEQGAAAFGPAATVGPDRGAPSASSAAPAKAPAPLRLSVGRADNGVFVYTLKNPDTGAVVAVIPRGELARTQGIGGAVDRKV